MALNESQNERSYMPYSRVIPGFFGRIETAPGGAETPSGGLTRESTSPIGGLPIMVPTICLFPECKRPIRARGLCVGHYAQRGRGKPLTPLGRRSATTGMTDVQRFWFHVNKSGDCWTWDAGKNENGYGMVKFGGRQRLAHTVSYELANGPIPPGEEIDHRCHNPACVRPKHLQSVTHKVNTENRRGAQINSKSGVRGVTPHGDRWQAQIVHNQKAIYIGLFGTIAEAEEAVIGKRNSTFTNNLKDRKVA